MDGFAHDALRVAHLMLLAEQEVTHIAAVCLSIVEELVAFQVVAGGKGPFTAVAGIRPSSCMNALELRVMLRWLTGKRAITVVVLHVFVQPSERESAVATNAACTRRGPEAALKQFGLSSVSLHILSTVSKLNLGTSGSSMSLTLADRMTGIRVEKNCNIVYIGIHAST